MAEQAELWAVFLGLNLAWHQGYRKVMLETYSSTIFNLLASSFQDTIGHNVLAISCKRLLERDWDIKVTQIYREANTVADGMVHWAFLQLDHELLLMKPPEAFEDCCSLISRVSHIQDPIWFILCSCSQPLASSVD